MRSGLSRLYHHITEVGRFHSERMLSILRVCHIVGDMQVGSFDDGDIQAMLINLFYAITISEDLIGEHEPLVSKAEWIAANGRLIKEIGSDAWLEKLLSVLQGDFPRRPR